MTQRIADIAVIITAAIMASAAIVWWHDRPVLITATCALILAGMLARFHDTRDFAGLIVGATAGNAIELASDAAGIWQHADRSVLGLAPLYILFCYPILGVAMPRLTDAIAGAPAGRSEDRSSLFAAAALLLMFVIASTRYGLDHSAQSTVCAGALVLTMIRFHARHDVIAAVAGALVALVWELPATLSGAWTFPQPVLFGLVPLWLPAAYAVFFVTMGRISAVRPSMPWPRWVTPNPNNA